LLERTASFFLLLLSSPALWAQSYHFQNYSVEHGLAQSTVYVTLQDQNGYLWIVTDGGGVSRFDGLHFVTFTPEEGLADNAVTSIMEDADGSLWFGTYNGVSRFDGHTFSTLAWPDSAAVTVSISSRRLQGASGWQRIVACSSMTASPSYSLSPRADGARCPCRFVVQRSRRPPLDRDRDGDRCNVRWQRDQELRGRERVAQGRGAGHSPGPQWSHLDRRPIGCWPSSRWNIRDYFSWRHDRTPGCPCARSDRGRRALVWNKRRWSL